MLTEFCWNFFPFDHEFNSIKINNILQIEQQNTRQKFFGITFSSIPG